MFSKKLLIVAIIALAVGLAAGYYWGFFTATKTTREEVKNFLPPVVEVTKVLSGVIASVEGNVVKLTIQPPGNPFDKWPTERKVIITDRTEIVTIKAKDYEVFKKETAAWRLDPQGSPEPKPYVEKIIKIEDLKAGDNVSVVAADDIKTAVEFEAIKIEVKN